MRRTLRFALAATALGAMMVPPDAARADEIEECAAAAEGGQALRDKASLLEAREQLVRCAQSSCPDVIRKDCTTWLAEVDGRIPSIVLHAVDEAGDDLPTVRVLRGGVPWLERIDGSAMSVDPGPLTLRFEAPGHAPVVKDLVIAEGQRGRLIEVTLPQTKASAPASMPPATTEARGGRGPLPWIFLGVGVAGLGTFGVLQLVAQGELDDLDAGCGATTTCTDAELDPTRTKLVGSAVGLGFGIAGLGASALSFVLLGEDGEEAALRVQPVVGQSGAGVRVRAPLSF